MDKQELIKTARLARLKLSEKEKKEFAEQLQIVFEYFKEIASVDTKGIAPLVYPLEDIILSEPLREDQVQRWKNKEELLSLASERLGDEYKVPPVVE